LDYQLLYEYIGKLVGKCKKIGNIKNNDEDIFKKYCLNCSDNRKKGNEGCEKCPYRELLNKIRILSSDETLDEIIYHNKSIARFGDGEFNVLIKRKGCVFQRIEKKLSERLNEVLQSDEEGFLVAISDFINLRKLSILKGEFRFIFGRFVHRNKFSLLKLLDRNKQYYSANISRFYIYYKNRSHSFNYVKKLKKLWNNRDVLIVEGSKTRIGAGNDLLNNTRSIKRILCPKENAFSVYDKILNTVVKNAKNELILISLGPTASVLAYDLFKKGYQAIDIGHVDMEYEWFIRGVERRIKIKNKYTIGVGNGRWNIEDIKDRNYFNQIIANIENHPIQNKKSKHNRRKKIKRIRRPKRNIKSNPKSKQNIESNPHPEQKIEWNQHPEQNI